MATCKDLFGCPGESRWLARRIKLRIYTSSSPLFYLCLRCGRQNADTTLSLQLPMKFGNIVRVETSRYLTKIAKVLVAKYTASLQLLCTAGGNQARLDAPTEFENLERSLRGEWKLVITGSLKGHICYTKSRIRTNIRKGSAVSRVQRAVDLASRRRSHGGLVRGQC